MLRDGSQTCSENAPDGSDQAPARLYLQVFSSTPRACIGFVRASSSAFQLFSIPRSVRPSKLVAQVMSKGPNDEGLVFETSEDVEVLPTFDALGLKEDLLRGVYAYGLGLSWSWFCLVLFVIL